MPGGAGRRDRVVHAHLRAPPRRGAAVRRVRQLGRAAAGPGHVKTWLEETWF